MERNYCRKYTPYSIRNTNFVFMFIKIACHLHAVIFTQLPHMNEQDIEDMFWNILIVSSAPFESFCRGYRVNSKCNGEWKILVIFLHFLFHCVFGYENIAPNFDVKLNFDYIFTLFRVLLKITFVNGSQVSFVRNVGHKINSIMENKP